MKKYIHSNAIIAVLLIAASLIAYSMYEYLTEETSVYNNAINIKDKGIVVKDSLLLGAYDITTSTDGSVYISDLQSKKVFRLIDGKVDEIGRTGRGPGEFSEGPVFLDYHEEKIVVSDGRSSNRYHIFDEELNHIKTVGVGGVLGDISFSPNGDVIAVDGFDNDNPSIFLSNGEKGNTCELQLNGDGLVNYSRIESSSTKIYAAYVFRNRIDVFNEECTFDKQISINGIQESADMENTGLGRTIPTGSVFTSIAVINDETVVVSSKDYSPNGRRDLYVVDVPTGTSRRITLPTEAYALHADASGDLLIVTNNRQGIRRYGVRMTN